MPTNDFLTFGQAGGANVMSQADYAALAARPAGFAAGIARSVQVNKVLRQAAAISAALAQAVVDNTGLDMLDNTNQATLLLNLKTAFGGGGVIAGSGWQKIQNGILMQWTTIVVGTTGTSWTYPITFNSIVFNVQATLIDNAASYGDGPLIITDGSVGLSSLALDLSAATATKAYIVVFGK